MQDFTQGQVQKILASEAFQTFWLQANRLVQQNLVAVLRGESDTVSLQNGQVVLNYLPLINQALQAVSGTLSQLLNRPITLPEITADTVPSDAIAKLNAALGVTLPATFGSVVVYSGDAISGVQDAVNIARRSLIGLVVVFLLGDRSRALGLAASPAHAAAARDGDRDRDGHRTARWRSHRSTTSSTWRNRRTRRRCAPSRRRSSSGS